VQPIASALLGAVGNDEINQTTFFAWFLLREQSPMKEEREWRHLIVAAFLKTPNALSFRVTLFAGNYDVDLYWPAVHGRIPQQGWKWKL